MDRWMNLIYSFGNETGKVAPPRDYSGGVESFLEDDVATRCYVVLPQVFFRKKEEA